MAEGEEGDGGVLKVVRIFAVETPLGTHPRDTGTERCAAIVFAGRGYGSSRMAYTIITELYVALV